jgi:dihydrofolate reductase
MRKIIVFNRVSIDGFFAGPNGESHEWFINDPKVDKAAHEMMNPDTILFGRETYEIFEDFWPGQLKDKDAPKELKNTARELNGMTKLVFSRRLKKVSWENSELMHGDLIKEVKKLKHGKGADIVIFGSGTIIQQLTEEKLIDEYLLVVTPVVLGTGISFFKNVRKFDLELFKTKSFKSGNVMLHYRTSKK